MATPVVRAATGLTSGSHARDNKTRPAETSMPSPTRPAETVIPSLSEMSNASSSSAFVVDEYSQFEQTYGPFDSTSAQKQSASSHDSLESSSSTFWDLLMSLYLPALVTWLRRSVLVAANLMRSLILGHFLRLVFGNVSGWMTENTPAWFHTLLQPSNGKIDPHAWPPPSLTALALLTVFALVVHPDGFTWIMVGKIRNAMLSLFESCLRCWRVIVKDYGVITTVAASATLGALFFLSFVVLRTLSPRRSKRPTPTPEKKKKKRKGNARHRGGAGARIRSASNASNASGNSNINKAAKPAEKASKGLSENTRDSDPCPAPLPALVPLAEGEDPPCTRKKERPVDSFSELPVSSQSVKPVEKDKTRMRVPSVSTLDTTTMSDDQSFESTSVPSAPSASAISSRTNNTKPEKTSREPTNALSTPSKSKSSSRRNKRGGGKSKMNSPKSEGPSRWDALKPSNHGGQNQQQSNHPTQHHQNAHHHPRSHGRRGGGNRKARNNNYTSPNNNPHSTRHGASSTTTKASALSRSATRSPVSPPAIVHQTATNRTSYVSTTLPPPPPGLGPLPAGSQTLSGTTSNPSSESTLLTKVQLSPSRWETAALEPKQDTFVSSSFLASSAQNEWKETPATMQDYAASPARFVAPQFSHSPSGSIGFRPGAVKENPFAPETHEQNDLDSKIEADLQELGGQMAGSILDF